jgi:hypothetical protein
VERPSDENGQRRKNGSRRKLLREIDVLRGDLLISSKAAL